MIKKHVYFLFIFSLLMFYSVLYCQSAKVKDETHLWSIRMAESVMSRHPKVYGDWDYVTGTVLKGFEALWRKTGDQKYFDYIKATVDHVVRSDGTIEEYDPKEYNIDEVQEGRMLLFLYKESGEEKYKKAAKLIRSQLKEHPRISEGGFWHKQIYPWQMWLDGLYMGSPFYAEYGLLFDEPEIFDDVVKQFVLIEKHLKDKNTGLFYHAWDEKKQMFWANKETGLSRCFWSRGLGWYAMALVDVLDYIPQNHTGRKKLIAILKDLVKTLTAYQDKETGSWWQVLDQGGREGNYLEASGSVMFVYSLAKAVRMHYIDKAYQETAEKGFDGLVEHLVIKDSRGEYNLARICRSAGLGGNYTEKIRDGSYAYYAYIEPIVVNDGKGVGPFISAGIEIELLKE